MSRSVPGAARLRFRPRHHGAWLGVSSLLCGLGVTAVSVAPPATAVVPTTVTFTAPGTSTWTAPAGVSAIQVTAVGGKGGDCFNGAGGRGDSLTAIVAVTPGVTYTVQVAGPGGGGGACDGDGTAGGIGGGGAGGAGKPFVGATGGGGGGGASLVSVGAGAPTLGSVLLVAGGGGGAAYDRAGGDAGQPGSAEPAPHLSNGGHFWIGATAGLPGTLTAGGQGGGGEDYVGAAVASPGGAGSVLAGGAGGAGSSSYDGGGAGGGGAGYYGGGGGGGSVQWRTATGGGGATYVASPSYLVSAPAPTSDPGMVSITYPAAAPPTASISMPADGGTFVKGANVPTTFSCAEGFAGTGVISCNDSNFTHTTTGGTGTLDTSQVGPRTYSVLASSSTGQTGTASLSYTVAGPPSAAISIADHQVYVPGQKVVATFSCAVGAYGADLASCTDSRGVVTVGGGQALLDTKVPGSYTYTVTATAEDGQKGTSSISYTVAGPPSATISSPRNNQVFDLRQKVPATFSCAVGVSGTGLASCTDSNGVVTTGGGKGVLDTSTPGSHTYTVTATARDGQKGTSSISYTVSGPDGGIGARPAAVIRTGTAVVKASGATKVTVRCSGTAMTCGGILKLVVGKKVVASARYSATSSSAATVRLKVRPAGMAMLHRSRKHRVVTRATATVAGGDTATRTVVLRLG